MYDEIGFLTNIIDAISITNQLDYIGGRVVALTTPYGTTAFTFGTGPEQSFDCAEKGWLIFLSFLRGAAARCA